MLDLNQVVVVQAGGTPHIPYMTFLARGKGEVKPTVVVLLDSDPAGDNAIAELAELGRGQPVIRDEFVLRLAEIPGVSSDTATIEDLVPWGAARAAVLHFRQRIGREPVDLPAVLPDPAGPSAYGQIHGILEGSGDTVRCGKVAFAKSVVETLDSLDVTDQRELEARFAPLVKHLAHASRRAAVHERAGQVRRRLARSIRMFKRERTAGSQRQWAAMLLDELEAVLDDGPDYEQMRQSLRDLRHEYSLSEDLGEPFDRHDDFTERLSPLLNLLRVEEMQAASGPETVSEIANGPTAP